LSPFVRAQAVRPIDRTLAGAVFCLLFAVYLATFSGLPENPDSEVEFQTTSALVRNQTLALGGTSESDAILGVIHQGRQGFNVRRGGPGREQEFFSWSGVGQPLVGFPFFLVGAAFAEAFPGIEQRNTETQHLGVHRSEYFEHLFVGLRNPLLGALTAALLVLAARRSGARRSNAVLCGLSYGLCTYAWPQARGTLSDVQATVALFLAFVLAQGTLERLERGRTPNLLSLLGFGLSLGVAFLTRVVLAPAVAVLVCFFVVRVVQEARSTGARFPLRTLLLGLLPALACFGVFLWVNELRFGDPLETGYGGVVGVDWFMRSPAEGLLGITVSPGSGLLWFAPGALLFLPWLVHALRRGEYAEPFLLTTLLLVLGALNTVIPSWHGAWSYGPRYVLPLLPFLWFPLGVALELAWEQVSSRIAVLLLLGLGFITALGGVLVEYNTSLDLTLQGTRLAWPSPPDQSPEEEAVLDDRRFVLAKLDWRFAQPWLHWRILRHRVAGLGEVYPARELFGLDSDALFEPQQEREKGFRHFAWVDLHERLGGPSWIGPALVGLLLVLSACLFLQAEE